MKKYEVVILPLAENDISSNTDYIFFEKKEPDIALNLLKGFYETIQKLSVLPERYEIDEDEYLAVLQIRKCYYKKYKIYFYVNKKDKKVFVLRVLHMLVDIKNIVFFPK